MALGGFLQGLGLSLGNDLLYGQQYQQNQARTELMKAEADQAQMQSQQMQQQMQTQKQLGAFIQSQTQLEGADASNPLMQAQMYSKAAGLAASQGDFASAQEMTKLSENATAEARQQAVDLAQQKAVKNEDLANAADAYSSNPSRDGAMDLARKAIAAGVNPATIPANLQSPEGQAWVNQQKLAGMTSGQRAEFVQKAADIKANREEKQKEFAIREAGVQAERQATATYREGILDLKRSEEAQRAADRAERAGKPQFVTIGKTQYEVDDSGKMPGERNAQDPRLVRVGEKTSIQEDRDNNAMARAGAQTVRELKNLSAFKSSTGASPFIDLTSHDAVSAIEKAGANAMTPDQVKMYGASFANLTTQVGRLDTLGGGRGANQAVINELTRNLQPQSTDHPLVIGYKLATINQTALVAMENSPKPSDPDMAKMRDENIAYLKSRAKPEDFLRAATGKDKELLNNLDVSGQQLQAIVGGEELPGAPDAGAGTNKPPIPAGTKDYSHLWN